jgi:predicted XRE-type DNA-binding protein
MADSVFYDIADTPDEAANLSARGMLMVAIEQ